MESKSFLAGAAAGIALTMIAVEFLPQDQSRIVPGYNSQDADLANSAQAEDDLSKPAQSPSDGGENSAPRNIPTTEPVADLASSGLTDSNRVSPVPIEQTSRAAISVPVTDSHKQLLGDNGRADKNSGSPGDVHNALEQEPKDYDWSYFMEQALGQFLGGHPEVANFEIAGIECRTTICEIQAFGVDENTGPRWGIIMHDIQSQPWSDFDQTGTSSSTIEGRLVIVTHLHRKNAQD